MKALYVDFDGILFDTIGHVNRVSEAIFGIRWETPREYDDIYRIRWIRSEKGLQKRLKLLGLRDHKEAWWWAVQQVHDALNRLPENFPPEKGAVEALNQLVKCFDEIYVATVRKRPWCQELDRWLDYWFPGVFKGVIIRPDFELKAAAILNNWRASEIWVIDDNDGLREKLEDRGIKTLSLRRPWTKYGLLLDSWRELANFLKKEVGCHE